jgi:uncharacterized lipoprotein YajG
MRALTIAVLVALLAGCAAKSENRVGPQGRANPLQTGTYAQQ